MRNKFISRGIVLRVANALILAIILCLISSSPASAQLEEEYFQFCYEPVIFSKTEIHGNEVFTATMQGRVTCNDDLPIPVSKARITGHVIAEHVESGTGVTLNSSYTTTIEPFPNKSGDTIAINEAVYLQFPYHSESGDYTIMGKLDKVEIPFIFGWIDVLGYLPQDIDQPMGTLKYIPGNASPTPTIPPTPTPTPTPTPATGLSTGTWVGIWLAVIIFIALAAGVWLIKRRHK
jgi:LPXTG-motif cell wall-anchored protein